MEKKIFVNQIKEGLRVEGIFLCSQKILQNDKNGKPYLNLKLLDRSGTIDAKVWDRASQISQKFDRQDYLSVKGSVVLFQGKLQFNIISLFKLEESQINPDDFLPHTAKNIDQMYEDLLHHCQSQIQNNFIKELLLNTLQDPQMASKFKRAPAAKNNHHAWIGGLLEHVLQLCQLATDVLKHYPQVNQDLVLAGLIYHDFGKIEEISSERFFEYTDRGRLIGHLTISVEILLKKAAEIPEFPQNILLNLQHIILSHHGRLEYGSPKEPMTLEALMVHHLDNMDSKLQAYADILTREESEKNENWTGSHLVFGQPMYKGVGQDMGTIKEKPPKTAQVTPENPAKQNHAPGQKIELPREEKLVKETPKRQPDRKPKESLEKKKHIPRGPLKTNLGELMNLELKKES